MAKVRAENDLKQMETELRKLAIADGHLKIEQGLRDQNYKPLQSKQKSLSK